jgi:hypothetical protein
VAVALHRERPPEEQHVCHAHTHPPDRSDGSPGLTFSRDYATRKGVSEWTRVTVVDGRPLMTLIMNHAQHDMRGGVPPPSWRLYEFLSGENLTSPCHWFSAERITSLTFRTLIHHCEAFLENYSKDRWATAITRSSCLLQPTVLNWLSRYSQLPANFQAPFWPSVVSLTD